MKGDREKGEEFKWERMAGKIRKEMKDEREKGKAMIKNPPYAT